MTTFKFTKNFDYKVPNKRAFMAFKEGTEQTVPQGVVSAALEAKAGHVVPTKNKNEHGDG